jgi:HAD superfamily hydrolase (TIGR01458 family)
VALFVPKATRNEFAVLDIVDWQTAKTVGAIIIGDLGSVWDFNTLNAAFRLLMHQPQPYLIALGLTRYWQAEDGLRLDTGPFVKALEYATGQDAIVLGKPAKPFFATALQLLGLPANKMIMIGDDIRGDIDAAQQCGIAGLLVRTGKFRSHDLEQGITPHAILDSVADLPAWWQLD